MIRNLIQKALQYLFFSQTYKNCPAAESLYFSLHASQLKYSLSRTFRRLGLTKRHIIFYNKSEFLIFTSIRLLIFS